MPAGWELRHAPRTISAERPDGPESVAVAVFRLAKPFRPALWDDAVRELNDVAARLAERIGPSALVEASRDATVAGRRARVYELRYERGGEAMVDRVTFLLVGRREYQLTCRLAVREGDAGAEACGVLTRSFRVR